MAIKDMEATAHGRTAMRVGNSRLMVVVLIAVFSGLGLVAYATGAAGGDPGPVPPDGSFLGWEAQGSLRDDEALASEAEAAWNEGSQTSASHTQTRVLFAGRSVEGGYGPSGGGDGTDGVVVVLQGRDQDGNVSLAYLTDLDWWSGLVAPAGPLRLVAEQRLGNPEGIRAVGSLAQSAKGGPMAIGLAEPGGYVEGFSSADWHSYSGSEHQTGLWLEVLPKVAKPETTTLTAKRGGSVIHEASLDMSSVDE